MHATSPRYKFSLVACARWEERDIVEWVEYHRAVGIEHFYIYSNDDTPAALFKVLEPYIFQPEPIITYRHWPIAGQQQHIYYHFLEHFKHETEWFSFLDIDEFMVFKTGNSIASFMAPFEDRFDAIYLNWIVYGHNQRIIRDDDSVLLAYTQRADYVNVHTKLIIRAAALEVDPIRTLFRAGNIAFWHFLNDYVPDQARLANVFGESVTGYTINYPEKALEVVKRAGFTERIIETAYIAHFQFKSEQDFERRAKRGGFANAAMWGERFADGSYKNILQSTNKVEDTYLAAFWLNRLGACFSHAALRPLPAPALPNIALRKPTQQSSVFTKSNPDEPGHVLGHGNDGFVSEHYGFHTAHEPAPWWRVNLLGRFELFRLHIYNRVAAPAEVAGRARHIVVETSLDGETWNEIYSHGGRAAFGGGKDKPLDIEVIPPVLAGYIRIISREPGFLHLDEVEIFGVPV